MAWGINYSSVVWTSGDTITEVKMDNMVANDQAHDAFKTEGLLLENNTAFSGEDTGAARRELIKVDAADDLIIGADNVIGHTVINAGTSKLVKFKVLHQNESAVDAYTKNAVILTGHGSIQGDGVNSGIVEDIVFGVTFDNLPLFASCNHCGYHVDTSTWTTRVSSDSFAQADQLQTTQMRVAMRTNDGVNTVNNAYYFYTWLAIGELA